MKIGVPKETHSGERRVATTPDVAVQLIKLGYDVQVESGAGAAANFSDEAYREAGCEIVSSARDIWSSSDIILKVRPVEVVRWWRRDALAQPCRYGRLSLAVPCARMKSKMWSPLF